MISKKDSSATVKVPKSTQDTARSYGTGRRKSSIARVWVKAGAGKVTVNKQDIHGYFPREFHQSLILKPFNATSTLGQFDVVCTVKGGGSSGQAGAVQLGISRALDSFNESFHAILRKEGLLTRDSRIVERKKYGKHKARKSTQFSKR